LWVIVKMPELISEEYRRQQEKLHENPDYGLASVVTAPMLAELVVKNNIQHILDYGAGKGRLGEICKEKLSPCPKFHHYDPAIPKWSGKPEPRELVACIDVLEHIEPNCLDSVLDDLQRVTQKIGFFTVHGGPAGKNLPDGRNAHLIQERAGFWLPKFMEWFELHMFQRIDENRFVIAVGVLAPKPKN